MLLLAVRKSALQLNQNFKDNTENYIQNNQSQLHAL